MLGQFAICFLIFNQICRLTMLMIYYQKRLKMMIMTIGLMGQISNQSLQKIIMRFLGQGLASFLVMVICIKKRSKMTEEEERLIEQGEGGVLNLYIQI